MNRKTLPQQLKNLKKQKKLLLAGLGLLASVSVLTVTVKILSSGGEEAHASSSADEHGDSDHHESGHSKSSKHAEKAKHDSHAKNTPHAKHDSHASHASHASHDSHASHGKHDKHGKKEAGFFKKIFHGYANLFSSIQQKMDRLKQAEEQNEKLRLENSHLRLLLESERYTKYAEKAQKMTQVYEWKLSKETGTKTGRTLASIAYRIPTDLIPSQLHALGTSYFKSRDDEKAAVIFTFLTGQEGDDTYKTAENYMLTGISWYRLDNYELSDFYFDQALKARGTAKRVQGQARLWKGIVSERLGKHVKAQFWFREVLDHDPRSAEARWVNNRTPEPESRAVSRAPAEESQVEESHEHGHEVEREPAQQNHDHH